MKCATTECHNDASIRVAWPGRVPPPVMCEACASRVIAVGKAIGLDVAIDRVLEIISVGDIERLAEVLGEKLK